MLGSIYTALSGMNAFSQGLQTISNNVANLNSLGYKSEKVSFSDLYNQSGTGGGLSYTGGGRTTGVGVRFNAPTTDFTQGTLQPTSGDLDLAIQGTGFLVLKDGANTLFSRTGQFAIDNDGFVTLQGTNYRLAILDSNNQPVAANVDVKRSNPPAATHNVTFTNNLTTASNATVVTIPNVNVFDASGGQHAWTVTLTQVNGTPNQWTVTAKDETGAALTLSGSTLTFNGGVIDIANSRLTATGSNMSVVLDFSGVTGFATGSTSSTSVAKIDGHASGTLNSVTVDADGKLLLTYSNAEKVKLGAVAIADFRDPQQLTQISDNLYKFTGSGQLRYQGSGENGVGALQSKQIEASNVNLTTEFGQLILVQRGFQASSQVVSVTNDMIQQLFGMRGQG